MDKDRTEGAVHRAGGAAKKALGKLTGDVRIEAEGTAEKAAGKARNTVGGARDGVRDVHQD